MVFWKLLAVIHLLRAVAGGIQNAVGCDRALIADEELSADGRKIRVFHLIHRYRRPTAELIFLSDGGDIGEVGNQRVAVKIEGEIDEVFNLGQLFVLRRRIEGVQFILIKAIHSLGKVLKLISVDQRSHQRL
ncbi:hypothetical protein SDC9_138898 [bioreactor metagenome]|uniref:Uncharacterized protein n=1 Tax=bioreactor metagenome TaxID=1076179 RepID=A0A645DQM4_9ZZZZ